MRPFRFRPTAVLDLRKKQEEAARDALARAQADSTRARAALGHADEAVRAAGRTLTAAQASGIPGAQITWHRSWIVKLRAEADARRRAAVASAAAAERAAASVRDAVQRVRVLERLRDRAWRRHRLEAEREHVRDMNQLAGLRFVARTAELGGPDRDDEPDDRSRQHAEFSAPDQGERH